MMKLTKTRSKTVFVIKALRVLMKIQTSRGVLTKDNQGFKINDEFFVISVNDFYDFIEKEVSDEALNYLISEYDYYRNSLTEENKYLERISNGEILLRGLEDGKECLLPNDRIVKVDDKRGLVSKHVNDKNFTKYSVSINELFSLASNIASVDIEILLGKR